VGMSGNENKSEAQPVAPPRPADPVPAPPLPAPTAPHVYVEKGLGFGTVEKRD